MHKPQFHRTVKNASEVNAELKTKLKSKKFNNYLKSELGKTKKEFLDAPLPLHRFALTDFENYLIRTRLEKKFENLRKKKLLEAQRLAEEERLAEEQRKADENPNLDYEDPDNKEEEEDVKPNKEKFEITSIDLYFGSSSKCDVKYYPENLTLQKEEVILQEFSDDLKKWIYEDDGLKVYYEEMQKSETTKSRKLYYSIDYLPPVYIKIKILQTDNTTRYVMIAFADVMESFVSKIQDLRSGNFKRADGVGSDAVQQGDVVDLSEFSIHFKLGDVLRNKNKHYSKFFDLEPLPKDYHKTENNCVRILLTKIFSEHDKSILVDGKFPIEIIEKERLEEPLQLSMYLIRVNHINAIFVDDNVATIVKNKGKKIKAKRLDTRCSEFKLIDTEVTQIINTFDSDYVIYLNGNHCALTPTRMTEVYLAYGVYYVYNESEEYLIPLTHAKDKRTLFKKIDKISPTNYYGKSSLGLIPESKIKYRYIADSASVFNI